MNKTKKLMCTIRHYSYNLTKSKHNSIKNIAIKYRSCRNQFYNQYGGLECLKYLKYPHALRDELVKSKMCEKYGLQARQWKSSLDEVFNTLKTYTEQWKLIVKRDISKNKNLNEEDRHYLYYLLCFYNLIYDVCKNESIHTENKFNIPDNRKSYLHRYLHNRVRKRMGVKPKSKSMSFTIDKSMYNVMEDKHGVNWLAITSLIPRKMIKIPLTDKLIIRGNLRVKVLKDHIEILGTQTVPCKSPKENKGTEVVAIDKGITNILNVSTGHKYGTGFGEMLFKFSDRRLEKNKRRSKLYALYNKCYEKKEYKKARRMLKYNLGRTKFMRTTEIERKELESQINKALNQFIIIEKPHTVVVEDLSFQSWSKKLSKNKKRHFSEWIKGYMQQRIDFKCQQNGVLLAEINPAYTSQTCPFCGFVHKGNRMGNKFHCLNCRREGDSDYFASLNILLRYKDHDIGLHTPYLKVKDILMRRFEEHFLKNAKVETVQPRLQIHKVGGNFTHRPLSHSENVLLSKCGYL